MRLEVSISSALSSPPERGQKVSASGSPAVHDSKSLWILPGNSLTGILPATRGSASPGDEAAGSGTVKEAAGTMFSTCGSSACFAQVPGRSSSVALFGGSVPVRTLPTSRSKAIPGMTMRQDAWAYDSLPTHGSARLSKNMLHPSLGENSYRKLVPFELPCRQFVYSGST